MKKFDTLLMKEKRPRMDGKMMTLTVFKLHTVYIKNHDNSFSMLCSLTCLNKDTSFVARYKYFNKLISKV